MYYYLDGTVAAIDGDLAVIDCGGVGYACHTSFMTASSLKQGERAKLFTYLHVREDIFDLYGFASNEELACFKLLLSVSGVGPKAAAAILSAVTPASLAMAVITEDEKALTAAAGVGKKLAQRILLELKDKMAKTQLESAMSETRSIPVRAEDSAGEAYAALTVLGYSQTEISSVLKKIDTNQMNTEQIIKTVLKNLAK